MSHGDITWQLFSIWVNYEVHELAPIMLFLHSLKFLLVLRSMMHGHGHGHGHDTDMETAIWQFLKNKDMTRRGHGN